VFRRKQEPHTVRRCELRRWKTCGFAFLRPNVRAKLPAEAGAV